MNEYKILINLIDQVQKGNLPLSALEDIKRIMQKFEDGEGVSFSYHDNELPHISSVAQKTNRFPIKCHKCGALRYEDTAECRVCGYNVHIRGNPNGAAG